MKRGENNCLKRVLGSPGFAGTVSAVYSHSDQLCLDRCFTQ